MMFTMYIFWINNTLSLLHLVTKKYYSLQPAQKCRYLTTL